jgi:hypothetical protein
MFRCVVTAFVLIIMLPVAWAENHGDEEEKTPLAKEMGAMNKAWRQVKKQAADANQNSETVKLLDQVIESCKTSVNLIPVRSEEISEDKRPAYIKAYKNEMEELTRNFESLRSLFVAGENEKAQKLIKQIDDLKKKGHKEYKPEDD